MFSEDGVSEDGVHRNVQQELGWGSTRLKLGCSRKVKAEGHSRKVFFPRLYRQRQPCPITLGVLPLRRWGTALANWGGALGFSSAFLLISGNLRKTKCFVFPLLGRKKDHRCLEESWRDNSGLAESLGTKLGLPGKKRCQELTGLAR